MNRARLHLLCLIHFAGLAPTYAIGGHVAYTLTDLGTLGGATSFANDVNNLGQVTGNSQTPAGNPSARLNAYLTGPSGGSMTNLGVLPGSNNFSRGYAVNDHGVVVGESGNGPSHAFVYKDGVMSNVGSLNASGTGVAYDVNNAGAIVGSSFNGTASKAFVRDDSGVRELGTIAGTAEATGRASAISEGGLIVGVSSNGTASHATLWRGDQVVDLGALVDDAHYSQALAVNDAGLVVGSSVVGTVSPTGSTNLYHAFAWKDGLMTDLGGLASQPAYLHSEARDVNDSGLIVGYVSRLYGSPTFGGAAVLWDGGIATDLNSLVSGASGWTLLSAEGINDRGQIVGYGSFEGTTRAFLLTPTAVPEPSSVALLALGGGLVVALYSRRSRGGCA